MRLLRHPGPRRGLYRRIRQDRTGERIERHYRVCGGNNIRGILVRTEAR